MVYVWKMGLFLHVDWKPQPLQNGLPKRIWVPLSALWCHQTHFDNPFYERCSYQSIRKIHLILKTYTEDPNFHLQKKFLIYLLSVPNDSGPHYCDSWHKILIFSLELELYQKRLAPSLIPTFRTQYERQIKKVSNLRNLFCIVPIMTTSEGSTTNSGWILKLMTRFGSDWLIKFCFIQQFALVFNPFKIDSYDGGHRC